MAKFRFKLEAKLKLAENALEASQTYLAEMLQKLMNYIDQRNAQIDKLENAFQGQREACLNSPKDLSLWNVYITNEKKHLEEIQTAVDNQQKVVNQARVKVMESHKEVKKFQKLKEIALDEYRRQELKIEQAHNDEVGQVLFYKKRSSNP